jgi:hypothetical protein
VRFDDDPGDQPGDRHLPGRGRGRYQAWSPYGRGSFPWVSTVVSTAPTLVTDYPHIKRVLPVVESDGASDVPLADGRFGARVAPGSAPSGAPPTNRRTELDCGHGRRAPVDRLRSRHSRSPRRSQALSSSLQMPPDAGRVRPAPDDRRSDVRRQATVGWSWVPWI